MGWEAGRYIITLSVLLKLHALIDYGPDGMSRDPSTCRIIYRNG